MLKGSEKALDGARVVAENASDLLAAAKLLAEQHRYGVATSLAILSAEEYSKAIALLFESSGLQQMAHPITAYFKSHKVKHQATAAYFTMAQVADYAAGLLEELGTPTSETARDWAQGLLERVKNDIVSLFESGKDPFEKINSWLERADTAKQRGLYVELRDGAWLSPREMAQEEYEEHLKIAETISFNLDKILPYITHELLLQAHEKYLVEKASSHSFRLDGPDGPTT